MRCAGGHLAAGLLLVLVFHCGVVLLVGCGRAPKRPGPVGMVSREWVDPARPRWEGSGERPLSALVWYPAESGVKESAFVVGPPGLPFFRRGWVARDAPIRDQQEASVPLVLLSHGTGGSAGDLSWLAEHLVARGYLVAAVSHHGNSILGDDLSVQGFFLFWERARDLSVLLDRMLSDPGFGPLVDPERVGVAGFSIGGHAAMLIAGARLDIEAYYDHCESAEAQIESCEPPPESPFGLPDLLAAIERDPRTRSSIAEADADHRDPRFKAAYAIAPAVVVAMTDEGIEGIGIPIGIVVGDGDRMAPADRNADRLARLAPDTKLERLPGVDHYTFLGECGWAGRLFLREICASTEGAPRRETLDRVADDAYGFFEAAWSRSAP